MYSTPTQRTIPHQPKNGNNLRLVDHPSQRSFHRLQRNQRPLPSPGKHKGIAAMAFLLIDTSTFIVHRLAVLLIGTLIVLRFCLLEIVCNYYML